MYPLELIQTHRKITGISAVLLPYDSSHKIDWDRFEEHVARTHRAGLTPAVNMDTGYVNLLAHPERDEVLRRARAVVGDGDLVAGAFVDDMPDDRFNLAAYQLAIESIHNVEATPVIFPSFGLTDGSDDEIFDRYARLAETCPRFIAFELGKMFAPFGRIYTIDLFRRLLQIPQCIGAKHSSLSRQLEWERLQVRNEVRPDFKLFTGNDLAIDMVMYGSDYLLGLSTMAPDWFAWRDQLWEAGDPQFYEINDRLQYLGWFAFRDPVPAYKHTAAMVMKHRGWLESDSPHPAGWTRPESDRAVLQAIIHDLEYLRDSTPHA